MTPNLTSPQRQQEEILALVALRAGNASFSNPEARAKALCLRFRLG